MKTAVEVHNNLLDIASKVNHQETRIIDTIEVGQAIRQGDVYLVRIKEKPSDLIPTLDPQIAKGNTKGSRHILEITPTLRIYKLKNAGPLDGPVIESQEQITLTHPEHAWFKLPGGCYSTHYQQDFCRQEIAAVRD
jgi:hypothetical protein